MTIASAIYQETKLPFVICATSAVYCAVMNKHIKTLEKPITCGIRLCAVRAVHKGALKVIENLSEEVPLLSTSEKICAYALIMSVFSVPALLYGKVQSWLLCKIAEFVIDTLKFTIGNLDINLGLKYQGLQWESTEETSEKATDLIGVVPEQSEYS